MILVRVSGDAFDVQNEQLFFIIRKVATVVYWISFVPVIPVLWGIALGHIPENKVRLYFAFDLISIFISMALSFQFLVTYLVGILGGV